MEASVLASDAVTLHRRALRLEWFTVSWNVLEAGVAMTAGVLAGRTALVGFGVDSGIETSATVALLSRLRRAGPSAALRTQSGRKTGAVLVGRSRGRLLMQPVVHWRPRSAATNSRVPGGPVRSN